MARAPARAWVLRLFWLGLALASILVPMFGMSGFALYQLTQALVYAIALVGLHILIGVSGQISIGHSAFIALGAYAAAILSEKADVSYALALPAAGLACFIAGFLFGLPLARLEGVYLGLATFALGAAAPQIFKLSLLEPWTGGGQGFVVAKPRAPFGLPVSGDQWLYALVVASGLLLYFFARNLAQGRTGRSWRAIAENPIAAGAMGVNVPLYKAGAFGLSAAYAGIAGAFGVMTAGFIAPDSFALSLSIGLLVGLMIGGVNWPPGALFGGAFLLYAPNFAESVSKGFSGAIYGGALLIAAMLAPEGIGGLFRVFVATNARFSKRRLFRYFGGDKNKPGA